MLSRKKIKSEIQSLPFTVRCVLVPRFLALIFGIQLRRQRGPAKSLRRSDIVVVLPFYGNYALMPSFLTYYRDLGADLFVMLDLSAEGALAVTLATEEDCAIWRMRTPPKLNRTVWYLNFLRARYASGRWCLSVEPSDFLAFRFSGSRKIKDLIEFIQGERRDHVYAITVEMYGERPAAELALQPGQTPFDLLPYFDAAGYLASDNSPYRDVVIRGGPQQRALATAGPALNRIPLIKWHWSYSYASGTRVAIPRRLNRPHAPWHSSTTACLLCFGMLNDRDTMRRAIIAEASRTIPVHPETLYRGLARLRHLDVRTESSSCFRDSKDLMDCGLMNPGQWF
jgi:hypothetical protein